MISQTVIYEAAEKKSYTVQDEVYQMVEEAIRKLLERNENMQADVVQYFQDNNMSGIESLLKEKSKNDQVAKALEEAITKLLD